MYARCSNADGFWKVYGNKHGIIRKQGKEKGLMETNREFVPKVKICGVTRIEEAQYLNEILPAYAGFVFWEKSRRNVSFAQAETICRQLDERIQRVAVTVSPKPELLRAVQDVGFDFLQVHGTLESKVLEQCQIPLWCACNLKGPKDLEQLRQHKKITGYVVDAGTAGSGRTFDWMQCSDAVKKAKATVFSGKTFILAGGLNPNNVAEAIALFSPDVVDVSSGVEGVQGKEKDLMGEFVCAVETAKPSRKKE